MASDDTKEVRILVVEDNRDTRLLLEHLLRPAWQACIVAEADEALAAVASADRCYDAVLIDINLGGSMDGVDLLARLREEVCYAHVPMVALTAYAMPDDRQRFLDVGFDGYLAKPFAKEGLHQALREALDGRREREDQDVS